MPNFLYVIFRLFYGKEIVMTKISFKKFMLLLLLIGGLTASVYAGAQHQINISGATLFADFFQAPASTNDYIDVDGDGQSGFFYYPPYVEQLAATYSTSGWSSYWAVIYRGVGSGTGLSDLVTWHSNKPEVFSDLSTPSDNSCINRILYCATGGVWQPIANMSEPGGCPIDPCCIDIAAMDVPTTWFVYNGTNSDATWNKKPTQTGYGRNPQKSWSGTQSNQLKTLGNLNTNVTSPDANTVFDTEIAWVPIAIIQNQGVGTGDGNFAATDLQYLFVTGRMPNGENLVAATRDSGSGTRNGAMNTMGVDPSFGRGDNAGSKLDTENDNVATSKLGKHHQVNNLGGAGIMETAVQYSRLGVGYTGLCGASRANQDARGGLYEISSVKMIGGNNYIRPNINNILDNSDPNTGYRIGGNETFVTVGNWDPCAIYKMSNPSAAAYIRNITASINDFVNSPGMDRNYNMPGEYMAYNFFLTSSVDALPSHTNPTTFVANAGLNQSLQDFVRTNGSVELVATPIPAFGSVKPSGTAPVRVILTGGQTYSDGRTGSYIDNGGNVVNANVELSARNKISGDFNYDGKRDMRDIAKLVQAVKNPRAFEQNVNHGGHYGGQVGDYVIPEVIGDFDGDGNFDANDVRYFADGLAIDPNTGKLNRSTGFAKVDQADKATGGNGNYFSTTLATGRAYEPNSGWSKADIAGREVNSVDHNNIQPTPGASPRSADGKINAKDIDYIYYVLRGGIKAAALGQTLPVNPNVRSNVLDWSNLDDAVWMDLSCDLNGDSKVDRHDVDVIVEDILGTDYGDVNLDGKIDANDRNIILANMGKGPGMGWAQGDINGDGYVTQDDLNMYRMTLLQKFASYWLQTCSSPSWCEGMDYDHSGRVDFKDFATMAKNW
jgi:hypothetical protein